MAVPYATQRPIVSDHSLAFGIYLAYIAGCVTLIPALIGVIIAHVKADDSNPVMRSHFQFQIRTFWIGWLYSLIGIALCIVLIGFALLAWWLIALLAFPLLFWWLVWSLIRIHNGMVLLDEGKPVANPKSWLFGN